jgi:hypothetical protein
MRPFLFVSLHRKLLGGFTVQTRVCVKDRVKCLAEFSPTVELLRRKYKAIYMWLKLKLVSLTFYVYL